MGATDEEKLIKAFVEDGKYRKYARPVAVYNTTITVSISLALVQIVELVSGCTNSKLLAYWVTEQEIARLIIMVYFWPVDALLQHPLGFWL